MSWLNDLAEEIPSWAATSRRALNAMRLSYIVMVGSKP